MFPTLVALLIALGLDEWHQRQEAQHVDPLMRQLGPLGFSSWEQAAWTLRVAAYDSAQELEVALLAEGATRRKIAPTLWHSGGERGWTVPEPLRTELQRKQERLEAIEVELEYVLRMGLEEAADTLESEHANLNDELLHASEELEIYQRGVEESEGYISNPIDSIMLTLLDPPAYWTQEDLGSHMRYNLARLVVDVTPPGHPPPLPLRSVRRELQWQVDTKGNRSQAWRPVGSCVRWGEQCVVVDLNDREVIDLAQQIVGGQLRRRERKHKAWREHEDSGFNPEVQALLDLSKLRASQIPYEALAELRRRMDTESYGRWWGRRNVQPGGWA